MRKLLTATLGLILLSSVTLADVLVTFQVDMREQTVSQFGVSIAGANIPSGHAYFGVDPVTMDTLPAWSPGEIIMVDTTYNGLYEVTMICEDNTEYQYKFVNGNAWGMEEPIGDNRSFTTGSEDTVVTAPCFGSPDPCDIPERGLFFSEYIEGSSNNKALEIYNPTTSSVSLDEYIIRTNYNGNEWSGVYQFPEGHMLSPGDVFVMTSDEADSVLLNVADSAYTYGDGAYITAFNGDDVRALCFVSGTDTTITDIIGLYDLVDPGEGWDVAGVATATTEHTLVRKPSVTSGNPDWNSSAGTDASDSEWIVYDQDTFDYLGRHYAQGPLVTFQVDMKEQVVSPNGVHVAGSQTFDWSFFGFDSETGENLPSWDPAGIELFDDGTNGDLYSDDNVYSVAFEVSPGLEYQYKYINGNAWGDDETGLGGNRTMTVGPVTGLVLPEVCFDSFEDCPDFQGGDTLNTLTFSTNVANAIANGGFELGDTLLVYYGYGGTQPAQMIDTLANTIGNLYSVSIDSVITDPAGLYYQYYRSKNGVSYREIYFNFEYEGADVSLAERRYHDLDGATVWGDFTISDAVNSNVDPRRQPVFRNADPIGQELTVTYTVDLRPAYYQVLSGDTLHDIQGTFHVEEPDSVFSWGVWINGPASGDWTTWGGTLQGTVEKQMHDDGSTGGDAVAGDSVYSVQFIYDATDPIGQEFKFGIHGGDNESGYGLNHIENIDVDNPTIASYWGSINPLFYDAWDYDTNTPILDVDELDNPTPHKFALSDNYPNPFNPTTEIQFTIPFGAEVSLNIYNLLGQKVATVHNGYAKPGTYKATWNGLDQHGKVVPSGVYLYELDAGSYFHKVKKMTLLK